LLRIFKQTICTWAKVVAEVISYARSWGQNSEKASSAAEILYFI